MGPDGTSRLEDFHPSHLQIRSLAWSVAHRCLCLPGRIDPQRHALRFPHSFAQGSSPGPDFRRKPSRCPEGRDRLWIRSSSLPAISCRTYAGASHLRSCPRLGLPTSIPPRGLASSSATFRPRPEPLGLLRVSCPFFQPGLQKFRAGLDGRLRLGPAGSCSGLALHRPFHGGCLGLRFCPPSPWHLACLFLPCRRLCLSRAAALLFPLPALLPAQTGGLDEHFQKNPFDSHVRRRRLARLGSSPALRIPHLPWNRLGHPCSDGGADSFWTRSANLPPPERAPKSRTFFPASLHTSTRPVS